MPPCIPAACSCWLLIEQAGSWAAHSVSYATQPQRGPRLSAPADEFFDRTATFARTHELNAYRKKRPAKEGVNLLSGKNSTGEGAGRVCCCGLKRAGSS